MKPEQAFADVELTYGDRSVRLKALVDTGASKSVTSVNLANKLKALTALEEAYELRTANKEGKLKIMGYCRVGVAFQGVEVPGGGTLEVAENLREDVNLIIGRPEIDAWNIIFTPEGPRPKKVPIEFEIL